MDFTNLMGLYSGGGRIHGERGLIFEMLIGLTGVYSRGGGGAYIRGEGVLTRLYGILYRNKASIINIWPLF